MKNAIFQSNLNITLLKASNIKDLKLENITFFSPFIYWPIIENINPYNTKIFNLTVLDITIIKSSLIIIDAHLYYSSENRN